MIKLHEKKNEQAVNEAADVSDVDEDDNSGPKVAIGNTHVDIHTLLNHFTITY